MRKFLLNLVLVPAVALVALSMISHCAADTPSPPAACSSVTCDSQCITNGAKCSTTGCSHCDCVKRNGVKMCIEAGIG